MFFAPADNDKYSPCGMFTVGHIILAIVCFIAIIVFIVISYRITIKQLKLITKVFAISLTILELIKIAYKVYYSDIGVDSIVPLSFCSLFIYNCYFSGFGKGKLEKIGNSYIVGGGIICGLFFLIFPTTSLTMHPLFHYLSLYSMLYHSMMVYLGIMYLIKEVMIPNLNNFTLYTICCGMFYVPTLIINIIKDSNLMFLKEPYRVPIAFLHKLQQNNQVIYTLLIMGVYLFIYVFSYIIYLIIKKNKITNVNI